MGFFDSTKKIIGYKSKKDKEQEQEVITILLEAQREIYQSLQEKSMDEFLPLLQFLRATAKLHDNMELIELVLRRNIPKNDDKGGINILRILSESMISYDMKTGCGRVPNGVNRTKRGEGIGSENVYIDPHERSYPAVNNLKYWYTIKLGREGDPGYANGIHYNAVTESAKGFIRAYRGLPDFIKQLLKYLDVKE